MSQSKVSLILLVLLCSALIVAGCDSQVNPAAGGAVQAATATSAIAVPSPLSTAGLALAIPTTGANLPLPPATLTSEAAMIAANPQEQWSEDFDGWKYMAFANKDRLQVTAICTIGACQNTSSPSSKQGILDYSALNQKVVDALNGKGEIEVMFRYPLAAAEYNSFLQESGLKVRLCVGHFGATDPAGPSIGNQCNISNDANYEGVVDILSDADATQVKQLLQDPRVFTVLVLRGIAIQKARTHLAATMPQLAQVPVDDSHDEGGLYLQAEAVGLVGKQQKRVPLA